MYRARLPVRADLVLAIVAAIFGWVAKPQAWADEPRYEVAAQNDVMVAMRDGVSLATDVYLPARDGKPLDGRWPVILMRTPYGKSGSRTDGEYFAAHGYAFVVQDTRGRFGSEGVWHMLTDDGRDGFDACDWIGKQPWSNGKVGTIGTSYVGGTQHALAMERPPQLVTAIPVDAMSNLGYASMRNGGAFELRFWNWIYSIGGPNGSRQARDPATAAMLKEMKDHRRDYLVNLPLRRGTTPLKHLPEYEDWLVEAMRHGGERRLLAAKQHPRSPGHLQDIPRLPGRRLVRLVGRQHDGQLHGPVAHDQGAGLPDHGALDSRRARR